MAVPINMRIANTFDTLEEKPYFCCAFSAEFICINAGDDAFWPSHI